MKNKSPIPRPPFGLHWWFNSKIMRIKKWLHGNKPLDVYTVIMVKDGHQPYSLTTLDQMSAYTQAMYWVGDMEVSAEHCAGLDWDGKGSEGGICFRKKKNKAYMTRHHLYPHDPNDATRGDDA